MHVASLRALDDWLSSLDGTRRETMAWISPDMASVLLERNTDNRRLMPATVEQYAGAMRRDEWMYNGDAVRVDWETGRLLDAQHRLHAVIAANTTIEVRLVAVPSGAQLTMDRGSVRNYSSFLQMRHTADSTTVAAAARQLFFWEEIGVIGYKSGRSNGNPTVIQLDEIVKRYPKISEYVSHVRGMKGMMPQSLAVTLFYVFALGTSDEEAYEFFSHVVSGVGLELGDPRLTLRNRLVREPKLPQKTKAALAVKAFNAWRAGRRVQLLRWNEGDDFPAVA